MAWPYRYSRDFSKHTLPGLKKARITHNLKREELAALVGRGITRALIQSWESGKVAVGRGHIAALCAVLGTNSTALITDEPSQTTESFLPTMALTPPHEGTD